MRFIILFLLPMLAILLTFPAYADDAEQQEISYMASWPRLPSPFHVRSWQDTARSVTLLTLDGGASYPYFPVSRYFLQEQPHTGMQVQRFGV
jgi:hypothetical protein